MVQDSGDNIIPVSRTRYACLILSGLVFLFSVIWYSNWDTLPDNIHSTTEVYTGYLQKYAVFTNQTGIHNGYLEGSTVVNRMPPERTVLSYDSILGKEIMRKHKLSVTTEAPINKSLTDPIDCKALRSYHGKAEKDRAEKIRTVYGYRSKTPQEYLDITKNCSSFITDRQYITNDWISDEEKNFPLAFSIRMHKSIELAERLLRAVYRPHNVYCIHIDKKSPAELHIGMAAIAACLPNVFLASQMVNVVYGSFGQTEADLVCMKDLIVNHVPWKYYLNLAGTEFPLKTNLEIVTILKYLNGTNDIEQYPYPTRFYNRFKNYWLVQNDTLYDSGTTKPPFQYDKNLTYLKGCSYNSFSRPFVEWALTADLPQSFINWTKDTNAPDELIWGTLNNLPDAPGGYPVYVAQASKTFLSREVIWTYSAAHCYGKYIHAVCILSLRELPWLSMRWELVANKFDLESDHIVYMCLEQELLHRVKNPDPKTSIPWYGIDRAPHVHFTRVLHKNITAAKEQRLFR